MTHVACLCPTTTSRLSFMPETIARFEQQIFPAETWHVELIVNAHPTDSLGRKLNDMIGGTRADCLVLWDDDDLHHEQRVRRQVTPLVSNLALITGTSLIRYWNLGTD